MPSQLEPRQVSSEGLVVRSRPAAVVSAVGWRADSGFLAACFAAACFAAAGSAAAFEGPVESWAAG